MSLSLKRPSGLFESYFFIGVITFVVGDALRNAVKHYGHPQGAVALTACAVRPHARIIRTLSNQPSQIERAFTFCANGTRPPGTIPQFSPSEPDIKCQIEEYTQSAQKLSERRWDRLVNRMETCGLRVNSTVDTCGKLYGRFVFVSSVTPSC